MAIVRRGALVVRGVGGRWLFVLPLIGIVVPPFYARSRPHLLGIPFVVSYQFLLVIAGLGMTAIAFWTRPASQRIAEHPLEADPAESEH